MKESKIFGEKMTDFEKNLFLKREVKELKEAVKKLLKNDEIRKRDFRIGEMQSEIDELRHLYAKYFAENTKLKNRLVEKKAKLRTVKALKDPDLAYEKVMRQAKALEGMHIAVKKLREELAFYRQDNTFKVRAVEKQDELIKKYDTETLKLVLDDLIEAEEALSPNCKYYKTIKKKLNL